MGGAFLERKCVLDKCQKSIRVEPSRKRNCWTTADTKPCFLLTVEEIPETVHVQSVDLIL